jgi:hypothetical protein
MNPQDKFPGISALVEPELELAEPATLESFAEQLETVRTHILRAGSDGIELVAELHLSSALAALGGTIASMRLASVHQARALAGSR